MDKTKSGEQAKPDLVVEMEMTGQEVRGFESMVKGFLAAALYGTCSVSSAFVTKTLLETLHFDFPVLIMASQMVVTIIILEILYLCGFITLPAYTFKRGMSFLWPSLFYGINAVLALNALAHMNIAMYGVIKRCVPISTMILSAFILGHGWPSRYTIVTVSMLSIGCVIAGYGDLKFNLVAYSCGLSSNFTHALYLLLVQRFSQHHKLTTTETLQLNSVNTLPILLLAAALNGEFSSVWQYPAAEHPNFVPVYALTLLVGMLLNYSLFLCTGLTSALTTSVVGGLKAMAQTLLGLVTFGGISHNLATHLGITLNLVGGVGYILVKYRENRKKLHQEIHKVLSFTNLADKANSAVSSSTSSSNATGYHENGVIPHASHDRSEDYYVKERSHDHSSAS